MGLWWHEGGRKWQAAAGFVGSGRKGQAVTSGRVGWQAGSGIGGVVLGGHGMALGVAGNGSRMGWQAVSGARQWQESSREPEVAGSINEKEKK